MVEHSRARHYTQASGRAPLSGLTNVANTLPRNEGLLRDALAIEERFARRAFDDFMKDPNGQLARERSLPGWVSMQHVLNLESLLFSGTDHIRKSNLLAYEIGLALTARAVRVQQEAAGVPAPKITKSPRHIMNGRKRSDEHVYRKESLYAFAAQQRALMRCFDSLPKDVSPQQHEYLFRGAVDYNFMLQTGIEASKKAHRPKKSAQK